MNKLTNVVQICALLVSTATSAGQPSIHAVPLAASQAWQRPIHVAKTSLQQSEESVPEVVTQELDRAAPPDAQVRSTHYRSASDCSVDSAEVTNPLVASGRAALKISGRSANGKPCKAYAFVEVKLTSEALIATRPVREGSPLEGSVRRVRHEIMNGETPILDLPPGALASRTLSTGQLIESQYLRMPGLNPGSQVRVLVQMGALSLEQNGIVSRCAGRPDPSLVCAQVGAGRHVEGHMMNGALRVGTP
jgi:flagella basal body P-ring formation protein FlgA